MSIFMKLICETYYTSSGRKSKMSNSESNFRIMLQAILDKVKSIANIKGDIKAIEPSAALHI